MFSGAAKSPASGAPSYIEDVFSTYLYTGTARPQTINNGIELGSSYGGSVYFDGTGDRITTPSTGQFAPTGDFTIAWWYYPVTLQTTAMLANYTGNNSTDWSFETRSTGELLIYLNGATVRITGAVGTVVTNQWQYFVVSRTGTTITAYRNGTTIGTYTLSGTFGSASKSIRIGAGSAGSNNMFGYCSNVFLLDGTDLGGAVPTVPFTPITGTMLLTCQSPNPVIDYSPNAFTLTVTDATAQNGGGPYTDSTANKGGMVWMKSRSAVADHALYDTVRGATFDLVSNSTAAQTTQTTGLLEFNNNGFGVGALAKLNTSAATYASWTFREQARFFDIRSVSHTNGTADTVDFSNLGTLGCVMYKDTGSTGNWLVWHRSLSGSDKLALNLSDAVSTSAAFSISGTTVTISSAATTGTKLLYAFAHNAGGFGLTGADNVITCGTYLGSNHRLKEVIELGYEPQWVMIKNITNATNSWVMVDNMRNMSVSTTAADAWLLANSSAVETTAALDQICAATTGFYFNGVQSDLNEAGSTFIYVAIRRGPMRPPTLGTDVFTPVTRTGTGANVTSTGGSRVTDLAIVKNRASTTVWLWCPRLTYTNYLNSSGTTAEIAAGVTILQANPWDVMNGIKLGTTSTITNASAATFVDYLFSRAPGFFDVVCYTGNAAATRNVNHNLGVSPEFVIIKRRSAVDSWHCWHTSLASISNYLLLDATAAVASSSNIFKGMSSTTFTLGPDSGVNGSGSTYVAYLFATLAGVSKVGSYTGNGASQTIDCGFTNGARFVLIKRTDATSNWQLWDTARGIVAGNDPYLRFNASGAEVATDDSIDTTSSGFIVNYILGTNINNSGGTYIFLAIA